MSIERKHVGQRMSQMVIHHHTVYIAGQVAATDATADVVGQTKQILSQIDALLAEAGTDKSNLLAATVWLADVSTYDAVNSVWDKWVPTGQAPARACVGAPLAGPQYRLEIAAIAAIVPPK